jgi:hypothetical protein
MPLAAVNTRLVNKVLGTPFGKAVTAAELPATPADKDGEGAENGSGSKKNERRDAEHREAVDERLRSLRAFARIGAGLGTGPPRVIEPRAVIDKAPRWSGAAAPKAVGDPWMERSACRWSACRWRR